MADDIDQYRLLVEKLLARTKAKRLNWSIGWYNSPECEFNDFKVRLSSGETAEGEPLEIVHLVSDANEIIDSFSDAELGGTSPITHDSYWQLMKELHRVANRQARGVDVAVKSILKSLDDESDDDVPF